MKVFVLTSHLEYESSVPETWVEGVFDTLEKAQKARDEVFNKQIELNWGDISEEDRELKDYSHEKSLYDLIDGNYMMLKIWEREVE